MHLENVGATKQVPSRTLGCMIVPLISANLRRLVLVYLPEHWDLLLFETVSPQDVCTMCHLSFDHTIVPTPLLRLRTVAQFVNTVFSHERHFTFNICSDLPQIRLHLFFEPPTDPNLREDVPLRAPHLREDVPRATSAMSRFAWNLSWSLVRNRVSWTAVPREPLATVLPEF